MSGSKAGWVEVVVPQKIMRPGLEQDSTLSSCFRCRTNKERTVFTEQFVKWAPNGLACLEGFEATKCVSLPVVCSMDHMGVRQNPGSQVNIAHLPVP